MSKDLNKVFTEDNLQLAWKWINSNTESLYKNYFRTLYKSYSLSKEDNIKELRKKFRAGLYEPELAIKVLLPKKSGILRPFTLLSINDQIVYQAMVNIIAENLAPKVRSSYLKDTFGHLYAGKRSQFFYQKWTKGYRAFNKEITKKFNDGYKYTATFDLTACYDSIDHKVIDHFLKELGLDDEFRNLLKSCLEKWTANHDDTIFLGHGIPQGPLSSGMLSEIVLRQFDLSANFQGLDVHSFRYVDDIRLMSKDEAILRKALINLDRVSKNIGLFPQSSKINIHEITNLDIELKNISMPDIDPDEIIDQDKVIKRLKELTKNNEIKDETKFKYILAHAAPSHKNNSKLLKLLDRYPHLYTSILNHFNKYKSFPKTVSQKILDLLKESIGLYEELTAYYLKVAFRKTHKDLTSEFLEICKNLWKQKAKLKSRSLKLVVLIWLINDSNLKFKELEKLLKNQDWWIVQGLIEHIDIELYGEPSYEKVINNLLKHEKTEVALNAVYFCILHDLSVNIKISEINPVAQVSLKKAGKIGRRIQHSKIITDSLEQITQSKFSDSVNWKKVINDAKYLRSIEAQTFRCRAYMTTDPTALINSLDVINDVLCHFLFKHSSLLGSSEIGRIGSVLSSSTSAFAVNFPKFYKLCCKVHELRLTSDLSHPKIRGTSKPTRRIKFHEIKRLRKILKEGYGEYFSALKDL